MKHFTDNINTHCHVTTIHVKFKLGLLWDSTVQAFLQQCKFQGTSFISLVEKAQTYFWIVLKIIQVKT